jgi:anthranilate synthase component 1
MKKFVLKYRFKRLLADTVTPVTIYLRLRDRYAGSILMESSDYHGQENSLSIICCDPIATFMVKNERIRIRWPDRTVNETHINERQQVLQALDAFRQAFVMEPAGHKSLLAGMFGYMAYDAVRFFDDVSIRIREPLIPDIIFTVYRFVIVIDHFFNEMTLLELMPDGLETSSDFEQMELVMRNGIPPLYPFSRTNGELSNFTDAQFLQCIQEAIRQCRLGNIFQLVLSRRFQTGFRGDEFNVYRSLRSINPSPYLFYFDYGNFRIFGSSPEAQIQIRESQARIYPIAGTFRRTGDDDRDAELARSLSKDEKENAEHNMLVDLARNDLSRYARKVSVEVFKEIQFYSHVIHLVSKVTGQLNPDYDPFSVSVATFPAGTLSGAPRFNAIQLIDKLENINRSFYGGALGYYGFDGSVNLAILIRSFLSIKNNLIYQAGAGVVAQSIPENELQEVNNKLAALRLSLEMAEKL